MNSQISGSPRILFGRHAVVFFAALICPWSIVACSDAAPPNQGAAQAAEPDTAAAIRQYVRQARKWPDSDYRIESKGNVDGHPVFWVLHKDDEHLHITGGGKSFAVTVDPITHQVLKELRFQ